MTEIKATAKSTQRIVLLDALRLFAALLVLCFHWLFRGPATGDQATNLVAANSIAMYGYIGVDWFFIISGFVISWTAEGRNAVQFGIARFARIYPGFIASMTITFLATLYFQPHFANVSLKDWLANLVVFSPALGSKLIDGAYWSILIELIFYGWIALFLLTGLFQNFRLSIAIVWLALALFNQTIVHSGALRLVAITEFAPWFVMGMIIHNMWKNGIKPVALAVLGVAFAVSCLVLSNQLIEFKSDYGYSPSLAIVLALNALGILLVIACIKFRPQNRRLARWSAFAGALSYPLYLLHQHIGYMLIDWFTPFCGPAGALFIALAAITVTATFVALVIERTMMPKLQNVLVMAVGWITNMAKNSKLRTN